MTLSSNVKNIFKQTFLREDPILDYTDTWLPKERKRVLKEPTTSGQISILEKKLSALGFTPEDIDTFKNYATQIYEFGNKHGYLLTSGDVATLDTNLDAVIINVLGQVTDSASSLGNKFNRNNFLHWFKQQYDSVVELIQKDGPIVPYSDNIFNNADTNYQESRAKKVVRTVGHGAATFATALFAFLGGGAVLTSAAQPVHASDAGYSIHAGNDVGNVVSTANMLPTSASKSTYISQPSNYQNDNLNVSGGTEAQEKKKEKKEFTHTSIYGAIIKNLEVRVCDSDGIRHYQLEVERKGGDIAFADIPLQKTPYVLEGGSVEIKGDIYNPDGKEIMKGATFQIDAQGKYKDLRELVQKYFNDLTLCSQETSELLKLNNNKTTTIEVIARGRNDHGCSAAAVPFLLNIVPKSESETYKMLVEMQNTINNMYNEFKTYKEAGKPVSEKFIEDVNYFLSWSHNIVTKGDLEKYITKNDLEKALQPIIDYINEKKAKDYGFSLVGAYSGGITKQNHGNLDTEIDIRNAIYSGKADLNLKFARLFADISHRNGSGNIFRDNKQVCEIKNTLTDVELEAQLRAKIGEILYIGPVAKYFSKTASTQAGLLDLSNNKGKIDEKDILNELYAGASLSFDDKLDLSGGYSVYSSAKRKGWNAGIRLNDLPIFGNGTVTLNAKGNAFFYNAPVNFVEGASLNGENYKGDVYVAIGKKGIAFVVGAYGSLENQRFILPGFDPSIVNKLDIKTSDIGGFAGIKLRF